MPPKTETVIRWLSKARDDLRTAETMLDAKPPVCWVAAFHAQQAAEKLLKGLLTFHEVEFERSHDIGYLLDLCVPVEPGLQRIRDAAEALTEYAVETRYPAPEDESIASEAPEALRVAHEVRQFVCDALPDELVCLAYGPEGGALGEN